MATIAVASGGIPILAALAGPVIKVAMHEPSLSDARKTSFAPVVDARTRLLVLGSLPGEVSLAQGQYYAHPQNQFWRLIGAVIGRDLAPLPYDERLQALLAAGVGLWDVVRSARRAGSLDTAIRDHEPNALPSLCTALPDLRAVAFNGGKASTVGRRALIKGPALITLPSSSPAHTPAYAQKLTQWEVLRGYLN
jgi:hypoxanthine-DNA glycosylase